MSYIVGIARILKELNKVTSKAINSKEGQYLINTMEENTKRVFNGSVEIGKIGFEKLKQSFYINDTKKGVKLLYEVIEKIKNTEKIELTPNEIKRLLNFYRYETYVYRIKFIYLLFLYSIKVENQNYLDELVKLRTKIELVYNEEKLEYLFNLKTKEEICEELFFSMVETLYLSSKEIKEEVDMEKLLKEKEEVENEYCVFIYYDYEHFTKNISYEKEKYDFLNKIKIYISDKFTKEEIFEKIKNEIMLYLKRYYLKKTKITNNGYYKFKIEFECNGKEEYIEISGADFV